MPFLRDEGPPVSMSTIQDARSTLPPEYGFKVVKENGRSVLLIRSPKPRPDYLHELEDAALYVRLDDVKDVRDVLLIGTEKVCRLEPLLLRDHIRTRVTSDRAAADSLIRTLSRDYGWTLYKHPEHANRYSFAIRIPKGSVGEVGPDDVMAIRSRLAEVPRDTLMQASAAYLVADGNFERLGRRVFFELVDPELAKNATPAPSAVPLEWVPGRSTTPTMVAPGHGMGASFVPQGGPSVSSSSVPSIFQPPAPALPQTAPPASGAVLGGTPLSQPQPKAAQSSARPTPPPKQLVSSDDNIEVYVRKSAPPPAQPTAEALAPPPPPVAPQPAAAFAPSLFSPPAPAAPPMVQPMVATPLAPQDSGVAFEPVVSSATPPPAPPEDPVATLDLRLRSMGYECVPGITVLGTVFDLAAHHKEGKRLLVKHVGRIQPAEVKAFEKTCRSVSADACVLVVDEVTPALRLATWGTPVEVLTPDEAGHLLG